LIEKSDSFSSIITAINSADHYVTYRKEYRDGSSEYFEVGCSDANKLSRNLRNGKRLWQKWQKIGASKYEFESDVIRNQPRKQLAAEIPPPPLGSGSQPQNLLRLYAA
jgi:hypothetical protein